MVWETFKLPAKQRELLSTSSELLFNLSLFYTSFFFFFSFLAQSESENKSLNPLFIPVFHLNKKDEKQSQVWHDFPRQLNVDPRLEKKNKKNARNKFLRAEMLDHITEKQIYLCRF